MLNPKSQNIIRLFLSQCLSLQSIPLEWKTSNLFLIPKKSSWDFTLDQVRPISLIEPLKKCLTKVFTTRLDQIINQHYLLSDLNFAATKNCSTHTLIQILLNTIEHTKTTTKRLGYYFRICLKPLTKSI